MEHLHNSSPCEFAVTPENDNYRNQTKHFNININLCLVPSDQSELRMFDILFSVQLSLRFSSFLSFRIILTNKTHVDAFCFSCRSIFKYNNVDFFLRYSVLRYTRLYESETRFLISLYRVQHSSSRHIFSLLPREPGLLDDKK